jgi:hypothetical protein
MGMRLSRSGISCPSQVHSALIEQRRAGNVALARRQQKQIATIRLIVRLKPLDNMLLAGVVWRGTRC